MPNDPVVTIITPTTGKDSLFSLIETITRQKVPVMHILLWDDVRDGRFSDSELESKNGKLIPEMMDKKEYWDKYHYMINNIILKGCRVNHKAMGSSLRSVGLMAANTDLVTFADDDIMWEDGHLLSMMEAMENKNWAFCKRKIWTEIKTKEYSSQYELLGVDEFESVGEAAKTPYKMVDNNCMMFRRKYGVSASPLYRETIEYNDDRLMYDFLKKYAGTPGHTGLATVNQVCPNRLVDFFRKNCTPAIS